MTKQSTCQCKEPLRNISEANETGDFATKCVFCGKKMDYNL